MQTIEACRALVDFRGEVYRALGHRKDSQFELMEAALCASGPEPLVHLSLVPAFRRRWPSACDGLADGSLDANHLRRLFARSAPRPPGDARELWAIDGTTWPRPGAATSPERTYGYRVAPGIPQAGVVPGWEYQWLVAVPEPRGSWVLPLAVRRRRPDRGTPTALALAQVSAVLADRPAGAARPVVLLDSQYDPVQLARSEPAQRVDFLARLARNRVFYRPPGPYAGRGAPRKHGPVFRLADPATHGEPDRRAEEADADYGRVEVAVWTDLHARRAADAPFAVVRVQVERLPRHAAPPAPLWLAWIGGDLPEDLLDLWRWYGRRFAVEHGFRFGKRALGWTAIRVRSAEAADRWTWLIAVAFWQLWLARALVADARLPWERALPAERLSPGRARRAFAGLLARLGSPARAPKPRGKAPGRPLGYKPGPRARYPVARQRPKQAA